MTQFHVGDTPPRPTWIEQTVGPLPYPPPTYQYRPPQFTPEEAAALRKIARKAIDKDTASRKREQLESLAEELGFDLKPRY